MTVLENNNKFHIEQGQIKTYDKLPTGTYSVEQNPTGDLYLALHENLKTDCKIYGKFSNKVLKVFDTYSTYPKVWAFCLPDLKAQVKRCLQRKSVSLQLSNKCPLY